MTIKELLQSQNLSEEQITNILNAMKDNKIFTASEENLDIRYGKLKTDNEGLSKKYTEAQALIDELQKNNKGNEDLQQEISVYKSKLEALEKELQTTRTKAAIKVGLLEAETTDVDYMTFKLMEKGELELDDNGNIKGWNDKIAGLKTQFPNHFKSSSSMKIIENKLPDGDGNNRGSEPTSLEDAIKFTYENKN